MLIKIKIIFLVQSFRPQQALIGHIDWLEQKLADVSLSNVGGDLPIVFVDCRQRVTSRWDYNIPLEGKRVGIIGTGATAVQVIPELAKIVGELFVFQRTPSTIDVRDQRTTTED